MNLQIIRDKVHLYEYVVKEMLCPETRSMSLQQLLTSLASAQQSNNSTTATAAAAAGQQEQQQQSQTGTVVQNIFATLCKEKEFSLPECFHLLNGDQHVQFSRDFQSVNLRQTRQLRINESGQERASRENHFDKYIMRHEDPNYLQLVAKFQAGELVLPKDPALVTLYEFASGFTLGWIFQPRLKVVLPTPLYRYVPRMYSGENMAWNPHHLEYCKTRCVLCLCCVAYLNIKSLTICHQICMYICLRLLLFKPNATPDNLLGDGQYDNSHDALMDYVRDEDSQCPGWLRKEFLEAVNKNQREQDGDQGAAAAAVVPGGDDEGDVGLEDLLSLVGSQLGDVQQSEAAANSNHREEERQRLAGELGVVDINTLLSSLTRAQEQYNEQHQQQASVEPTIPPSSLNTTQKAAFNLIVHHLRKKRTALYDISGKAGCGKSHFVKCLVQYIRRHFGPESVHVVAATGAAASQFEGGQTLHAFLKLPIGGGELEPLSPSELAEKRRRWRKLKFLIGDEKSLLSLPMFNMSSTRLQQIFPHNEQLVFGGLSVLIVGDLSQLPPVGAICLYNRNTFDNEEANRGRELYHQFDRYSFTFEQQVRQAGHESFSDQLARQGDGGLALDDWRQWTQRSWSSMSLEDRATFRDAILLAPRRDMLTAHNHSMMASLGSHMFNIVAYNSPPNGAANTTDQADGLPNNLNLAVGGRVLLTRNLWTECSLVNGALGTIVGIIFQEDNNSDLANGLLIQFDSYTGQSCLPTMERVVALTPLTARYSVGNKSFLRKSYPLQAAYGLTIHKAQGMTLDKVLIKFGE